MNTNDFVKILKKIAFMLELMDENQFKIKAYLNAADYIEEHQIDIFDAVKTGQIAEFEGFGKAIQEKAAEFVQSGQLNYLLKLQETVPDGLFELRKVKGLGPKKIKQLWNELNIVDIDSLEDACVNNLLPNLKGFTDKSQEEIFNSLSHQKAGKNKMLQDANTSIADELLTMIQAEPNVKLAEFTGELRRFSELVSEIDIIVMIDEQK